MKLINVHMLSTSEQVEKANVLLTEARQHLEEYESSIGQDNHMMAEGLLAIARDCQVGLQDKNMFDRYLQAHECLETAQRAHKVIKQLILGLY